MLPKALERPKRLELDMTLTLDDMPVITPCRGDKGEEGGRSEEARAAKRLEPQTRHAMHMRATRVSRRHKFRDTQHHEMN